MATPQSMLWTEDSINCTQRSKEAWRMPLPMSCVRGLGNKMSNMTELPNPFLAQLPFGYSSGLIRQYLLRINSTAHRETISETEYPKDCKSLPGAFSAEYSALNLNYPALTGWGSWSLEACMPANLTKSPWRAIRKRQDFIEDLYLNISLDAADGMYGSTTPQERGGLFKISLATTAG